MDRGKIAKFFALLLILGIIFSDLAVSYAYSRLPKTGEPNSTQEVYNEDGSVKRKRFFDKDGNAKKDIDYDHGGKKHHYFPHIHDWEWKEGKSKRNPPREPREGEVENAKKITTRITLGTIIYCIISEGSRFIIPLRNLFPVL